MAYEKYFQWLINKIEYTDGYIPLLTRLWDIPFNSQERMDENRAADGVGLRYSYFTDPGIVAGMNYNHPVSVLEVFIALAGRMNSIVEDSDDRAPEFFWTMINNIGLGLQTADNFDPSYVDFRLDILFNKQYERDGSGGGLFVITNQNHDMRDADLWYQAMWYLAEEV